MSKGEEPAEERHNLYKQTFYLSDSLPYYTDHDSNTDH